MGGPGKRKRLLRRAEILLLAFLGAAAVWYAVNAYRERRAVEAELNQWEASGAGREESLAAESGELLVNGKRYRRNTYVKAVLCMGVDRSGSMEEAATPGFGGQADGVFLIAQDTARNSLKILMIPRDTMTEITLTDLSGNVLGKDVQHLTLAYAYGDGREKSCEYMAEAVSGLLGGLKIDSYLAVDTDVISILNDLAGGVTVTVPTEGMEKQNPKFVYGSTVTLRGEEAEQFVRYRDTDRSQSALYRMDQQEEYIRQFFKAVKERSEKDSGLVSGMFEAIESYMVTDMSKDQYLKLAADALESEGLTEGSFYTVPGEGVATAKYDEFYPDEEALRDLVLALFYRESS